MSGFDRMLKTLGREDMLRCAQSLLKALSGQADADAGYGGESTAAAAGKRSGGGRLSAAAGSEALGYGGQSTAAAVRRERGGVSAPGGAGQTERAALPDGGASVVEPCGPGDTPRPALRARGAGDGEADAAERGRAYGLSGTEADAAAFSGPERRYDNAVGARDMEMSRVSDYFRRDSRRYDAGFTRY